MGLLLATKLLPAGDEFVMLSVYEAVGPLFISRLLRPLHTPQVRLFCSHQPWQFLELTRCTPNVADCLWLQTSRSDPEDGQKAAAAAGLGLAVLARLSTAPKLAVTAEFMEKVPLLLKVYSSLLKPIWVPIIFDVLSPRLVEIARHALLAQQDCRDMRGRLRAASSCNVSRNPATVNGLGGTCGW